jgi:hypothetical protein
VEYIVIYLPTDAGATPEKRQGFGFCVPIQERMFKRRNLHAIPSDLSDQSKTSLAESHLSMALFLGASPQTPVTRFARAFVCALKAKRSELGRNASFYGLLLGGPASQSPRGSLRSGLRMCPENEAKRAWPKSIFLWLSSWGASPPVPRGSLRSWLRMCAENEAKRAWSKRPPSPAQGSLRSGLRMCPENAAKLSLAETHLSTAFYLGASPLEPPWLASLWLADRF